jgi:hypothetical protein
MFSLLVERDLMEEILLSILQYVEGEGVIVSVYFPHTQTFLLDSASNIAFWTMNDPA